MASDNAGFEAAYVQAASARCAWVSRAASSAELIAKLGLMGAGDRLVACADDPDAFERHLGWHGLSLIADPSPDAFIAAGAAAVGVPAASDTAEPFARASYAYAAGACPGRTFWYVDMLCGPVLRVADVRALGRAARMAGVTLIVGNSVPTVACCRPRRRMPTVCSRGPWANPAEPCRAPVACPKTCCCMPYRRFPFSSTSCNPVWTPPVRSPSTLRAIPASAG